MGWIWRALSGFALGWCIGVLLANPEHRILAILLVIIIVVAMILWRKLEEQG